MYFLSFDALHIILTSTFLLVALGIVFFRYKKYLFQREKTINYTTNKNFTIIRLTGLILSILLLGVTILEPTGLIKNSISPVEWIDCIWLLDVSASMDAEDIMENTSPISRLTKAKSVIENFIISHPENRYGLVIFAGTSRLVSPLTSEHSSLLTFLASIDSRSIGEGGTDFHDALSLSTGRFETKENLPHAIALLSDGGDKEDTPSMNSIKNIFQNKNTSLVTIGLGQTQPSPIPVGRDPLGEIVYKKFQWEVVLSGLNRISLKSLAEIGKWSYIEGGSIEKDLDTSLNIISRQEFQSSSNDSNDRTVQWIMAMSFFFFLIFLLFPSSFKKRWNAL